jgi:MFS family permease
MPGRQVVATKRFTGRLSGALTGLALGLSFGAVLGAVEHEIHGPSFIRFFPMVDWLVEGAILGLFIFGLIIGLMCACAGFFIGWLMDRSSSERRRKLSIALITLLFLGTLLVCVSVVAYDQGWSPRGPTYKMRDVHYWKMELRSKSDTGIENAKKELASGKRKAFPVVLSLLNDEDYYYRCCAAEIFEMMGPDAAPAVPELTNALHDRPDPYHFVAARAAKALAAIGPAARSALPDLRRAREADMWDNVRDDIDRAIEALQSSE